MTRTSLQEQWEEHVRERYPMLHPDRLDYDQLDPGIADYVRKLREAGVETYESCEGGEGHSFPVPTVRFHGVHSEGFRAFDAARKRGLPVRCLRRFWQINDGEPCGPHWELTFRRKATDA